MDGRTERVQHVMRPPRDGLLEGGAHNDNITLYFFSLWFGAKVTAFFRW